MAVCIFVFKWCYFKMIADPITVVHQALKHAVILASSKQIVLWPVAFVLFVIHCRSS